MCDDNRLFVSVVQARDHGLRVAVNFDNFGPYHLARLSAAAAHCDLLGIETAGTSSEYAWGVSESWRAFRRVTLFPGGTSSQYGRRQIAQAMERALDDFRPEAIAIPGWHDRAGLSALRWARRHQVPVVVMSDSNMDDAPRVAWREAIKRNVVSLCSAGLVAGTRAATYLEQLGMSQDAIAPGYDTIDNAYFAASADTARRDALATRERLALPERYFLSCSRFVPKKNLAFLIEAYARYADERGADAWPLVLVGDGDSRESLLALIEQLKLRGQVHFPGFASYQDLPAYYGLAGGFVLASTVDQWGLVVNEAMACGLPVLVSQHCGCATDLVQDGANGFVFDPADHAALVRGFESVAHGGQAAKLGECSRRIIADWGPDRFAKGLIDMVQSATERPLPRATLLARATLAAMVR